MSAIPRFVLDPDKADQALALFVSDDFLGDDLANFAPVTEESAIHHLVEAAFQGGWVTTTTGPVVSTWTEDKTGLMEPMFLSYEDFYAWSVDVRGPGRSRTRVATIWEEIRRIVRRAEPGEPADEFGRLTGMAAVVEVINEMLASCNAVLDDLDEFTSAVVR